MADELRHPLTQRTGSSFLKACFNGTNAFLGIGLLTVPYALSSGGWLSLVLFFLIAAMSFYTGLLLKRCLDADPSIRSYLDIAERAFGTKGRVMVYIIMNSELYLVAIGLLILEGDNLHKLFPNFMIKIGSLAMDGRQSFVIITALVILPSMLFTDLSILSYVSATGVFSCLIILGSVVSAGAIDVGFHAEGSLLNVDGIPTAVSLYIVCFAGHPVIPSIYTSMQHVYQFSKVLLVSFIVTITTYLSMAIVSYLMFGENVESQITLNLSTGEVSAKIAIYTTLLIPVTRYALMVTPVATAIESGLSDDYKNWRPVRLTIRIALLFSTVIVAYVFPYYESLMAIVGSIFVVLASFLLPCFCYLKISDSYHSWSYELMGIVGIIVFASFAGILGTYSSVAQLVDDY
ncbi:amino acid transporter AVT1I-like [Cornus florida]|uniref:amino acid transporter AVT1I-like n=1 Tax=Cornus florida TaxID=4283 RepID=UPI00289E1017|nr:amino acid transporter AVT1I-like [Cornus florida]XP_059661848.1 amino acid transporter AVT1I-like [Cornus florida]XP_059661849.1 amino acid transporter AVT1I-like [Cornus florida]XP_059661850.1 amino acid transporter AVT1I-like [Cornus florida]XP_059661851.1 amino acid transporter AVT1I-like [Cornus florida]XP_059661852.1 amino acid transporter AVT1I-like [Cornus florida]XP_059661853.1 amino acid transporter AVT1I-like [Cornus florida]